MKFKYNYRKTQFIKKLYPVFVSLLIFCDFAISATLEDLDKILVQSGSIQKFLASAEAKDRYYNAAADYYGGTAKFPRISFDAILAQLKEMTKDVPQLNDRLWETPEDSWMGDSFQIRSNVKSFGREINYQAWNHLLIEIENDLVNSISQVNPSLVSNHNWEKVYERMEFLWNQLKQSETYLTASKKTKTNLEVQKVRELRADSEVQTWARQIALEALNNASIKELLKSKDPDEVLHTYTNLVKWPEKYIHPHSTNSNELMYIVNSEARAQFPNVATLLKDLSLFPKKMLRLRDGKSIEIGSMGDSFFDFKRLPRKFHGIFKSVRIRECMGGDYEQLSMLSPERWASGAIQNAEIQYIEENGSFDGFVEVIPGHINGHTYGSVDFGSTALRKNVLSIDGEGKISKRTLASLWIEKVTQSQSSHWEGIVMSNVFAFTNSGVIFDVFSSFHYLKGKRFEVAPFQFNYNHDKIANSLLWNIRFKPKYFNKNYGGNWITDATVSPRKSRILTILEPEYKATDSDYEKAMKLLNSKNSRDLEQAAGIASFLIVRPDLSNEDSLKIINLVNQLMDKDDQPSLEILCKEFFSKPISDENLPSYKILLSKAISKAEQVSLENLAGFTFVLPQSKSLTEQLNQLIDRAQALRLNRKVFSGTFQKKSEGALPMIARFAFANHNTAGQSEALKKIIQYGGKQTLTNLKEFVFKQESDISVSDGIENKSSSNSLSTEVDRRINELSFKETNNMCRKLLLNF